MSAQARSTHANELEIWIFNELFIMNGMLCPVCDQPDESRKSVG